MVLIWACLLLASAETVFGWKGDSDTYVIDGVERFCDCSYKFYHGCKTITPAPAGFACQCQYVYFWTCRGIPRKCDKDDWCPADDFSHEGCIKAGNLATQMHKQGKIRSVEQSYNCNGVENCVGVEWC